MSTNVGCKRLSSKRLKENEDIMNCFKRKIVAKKMSLSESKNWEVLKSKKLNNQNARRFRPVFKSAKLSINNSLLHNRYSSKNLVKTNQNHDYIRRCKDGFNRKCCCLNSKKKSSSWRSLEIFTDNSTLNQSKSIRGIIYLDNKKRFNKKFLRNPDIVTNHLNTQKDFPNYSKKNQNR